MYEASDTMEDSPTYSKGDIVWVKLSSYWWPGEVVNEEDLPGDLLSDFKKPPLVIVKFFDEDSFEYVKSWSSIHPYNSGKKCEFINKGMAGFRSKLSHMATFPKDIGIAEERTNGNPNILSQPEFLPAKKINYDEFFGTPSPKKSTKGKTSLPSTKKTPAKDNNQPHITHRRFLGNDDYRAYICIQYPGKDRKWDSDDEELKKLNEDSDKVLACDSCSFKTKRLEVMILHTKMHIQGIYITSKRKTKQPKSADAGTDSESEAAVVMKSPKPKQRKKKEVTPKTSDEIFTNLLGEWDDTDEEMDEPITYKKAKKKVIQVMKSSADSKKAENQKVKDGQENKLTCKETSNGTVEGEPGKTSLKNTHDDIKNCFDFDEEEEDDDILLPTSVGRKIPRVIPEKHKPSISELLEQSEKEDELEKERAAESVGGTEKNIESSKFTENGAEASNKDILSRASDVDENIENTFKELMAETTLPELDNLAQNLKPEQNFHDARTVKFPDKGGTSSKGGTSKKRFVTSFDDFEAGFKKLEDEEGMMEAGDDKEVNTPKTSKASRILLDDSTDETPTKLIIDESAESQESNREHPSESELTEIHTRTKQQSATKNETKSVELPEGVPRKAELLLETSNIADDKPASKKSQKTTRKEKASIGSVEAHTASLAELAKTDNSATEVHECHTSSKKSQGATIKNETELVEKHPTETELLLETSNTASEVHVKPTSKKSQKTKQSATTKETASSEPHQEASSEIELLETSKLPAEVHEKPTGKKSQRKQSAIKNESSSFESPNIAAEVLEKRTSRESQRIKQDASKDEAASVEPHQEVQSKIELVETSNIPAEVHEKHTSKEAQKIQQGPSKNEAAKAEPHQESPSKIELLKTSNIPAEVQEKHTSRESQRIKQGVSRNETASAEPHPEVPRESEMLETSNIVAEVHGKRASRESQRIRQGSSKNEAASDEPHQEAPSKMELLETSNIPAEVHEKDTNRESQRIKQGASKNEAAIAEPHQEAPSRIELLETSNIPAEVYEKHTSRESQRIKRSSSKYESASAEPHQEVPIESELLKTSNIVAEVHGKRASRESPRIKQGASKNEAASDEPHQEAQSKIELLEASNIPAEVQEKHTSRESQRIKRGASKIELASDEPHQEAQSKIELLEASNIPAEIQDKHTSRESQRIKRGASKIEAASDEPHQEAQSKIELLEASNIPVEIQDKHTSRESQRIKRGASKIEAASDEPHQEARSKIELLETSNIPAESQEKQTSRESQRIKRGATKNEAASDEPHQEAQSKIELLEASNIPAEVHEKITSREAQRNKRGASKIEAASDEPHQEAQSKIELLETSNIPAEVQEKHTSRESQRIKRGGTKNEAASDEPHQEAPSKVELLETSNIPAEAQEKHTSRESQRIKQGASKNEAASAEPHQEVPSETESAEVSNSPSEVPEEPTGKRAQRIKRSASKSESELLETSNIVAEVHGKRASKESQRIKQGASINEAASDEPHQEAPSKIELLETSNIPAEVHEKHTSRDSQRIKRGASKNEAASAEPHQEVPSETESAEAPNSPAEVQEKPRGKRAQRIKHSASKSESELLEASNIVAEVHGKRASRESQRVKKDASKYEATSADPHQEALSKIELLETPNIAAEVHEKRSSRESQRIKQGASKNEAASAEPDQGVPSEAVSAEASNSSAEVTEKPTGKRAQRIKHSASKSESGEFKIDVISTSSAEQKNASPQDTDHIAGRRRSRFSDKEKSKESELIENESEIDVASQEISLESRRKSSRRRTKQFVIEEDSEAIIELEAENDSDDGMDSSEQIIGHLDEKTREELAAIDLEIETLKQRLNMSSAPDKHEMCDEISRETSDQPERVESSTGKDFDADNSKQVVAENCNLQEEPVECTEKTGVVQLPEQSEVPKRSKRKTRHSLNKEIDLRGRHNLKSSQMNLDTAELKLMEPLDSLLHIPKPKSVAQLDELLSKEKLVVPEVSSDQNSDLEPTSTITKAVVELAGQEGGDQLETSHKTVQEPVVLEPTPRCKRGKTQRHAKVVKVESVGVELTQPIFESSQTSVTDLSLPDSVPEALIPPTPKTRRGRSQKHAKEEAVSLIEESKNVVPEPTDIAEMGKKDLEVVVEVHEEPTVRTKRNKTQAISKGKEHLKGVEGHTSNNEPSSEVSPEVVSEVAQELPVKPERNTSNNEPYSEISSEVVSEVPQELAAKPRRNTSNNEPSSEISSEVVSEVPQELAAKPRRRRTRKSTNEKEQDQSAFIEIEETSIISASEPVAAMLPEPEVFQQTNESRNIDASTSGGEEQTRIDLNERTNKSTTLEAEPPKAILKDVKCPEVPLEETVLEANQHKVVNFSESDTLVPVDETRSIETNVPDYVDKIIDQPTPKSRRNRSKKAVKEESALLDKDGAVARQTKKLPGTAQVSSFSASEEQFSKTRRGRSRKLTKEEEDLARAIEESLKDLAQTTNQRIEAAGDQTNSEVQVPEVDKSLADSFVQEPDDSIRKPKRGKSRRQSKGKAHVSTVLSEIASKDEVLENNQVEKTVSLVLPGQEGLDNDVPEIPKAKRRKSRTDDQIPTSLEEKSSVDFVQEDKAIDKPPLGQEIVASFTETETTDFKPLIHDLSELTPSTRRGRPRKHSKEYQQTSTAVSEAPKSLDPIQIQSKVPTSEITTSDPMLHDAKIQDTSLGPVSSDSAVEMTEPPTPKKRGRPRKHEIQEEMHATPAIEASKITNQGGPSKELTAALEFTKTVLELVENQHSATETAAETVIEKDPEQEDVPMEVASPDLKTRQSRSHSNTEKRKGRPRTKLLNLDTEPKVFPFTADTPTDSQIVEPEAYVSDLNNIKETRSSWSSMVNEKDVAEPNETDMGSMGSLIQKAIDQSMATLDTIPKSGLSEWVGELLKISSSNEEERSETKRKNEEIINKDHNVSKPIVDGSADQSMAASGVDTCKNDNEPMEITKIQQADKELGGQSTKSSNENDVTESTAVSKDYFTHKRRRSEESSKVATISVLQAGNISAAGKQKLTEGDQDIPVKTNTLNQTPRLGDIQVDVDQLENHHSDLDTSGLNKLDELTLPKTTKDFERTLEEHSLEKEQNLIIESHENRDVPALPDQRDNDAKSSVPQTMLEAVVDNSMISEKLKDDIIPSCLEAETSVLQLPEVNPDSTTLESVQGGSKSVTSDKLPESDVPGLGKDKFEVIQDTDKSKIKIKGKSRRTSVSVHDDAVVSPENKDQTCKSKKYLSSTFCKSLQPEMNELSRVSTEAEKFVNQPESIGEQNLKYNSQPNNTEQIPKITLQDAFDFSEPSNDESPKSLIEPIPRSKRGKSRRYSKPESTLSDELPKLGTEQEKTLDKAIDKTLVSEEKSRQVLPKKNRWPRRQSCTKKEDDTDSVLKEEAPTVPDAAVCEEVVVEEQITITDSNTVNESDLNKDHANLLATNQAKNVPRFIENSFTDFNDSEIILPPKKSKRVSEVKFNFMNDSFASNTLAKKADSDILSFPNCDDSIMSTSLRNNIEGLIKDIDSFDNSSVSDNLSYKEDIERVADVSKTDTTKIDVDSTDTSESIKEPADISKCVPPKKKKIEYSKEDTNISINTLVSNDIFKTEDKLSDTVPQPPKKKIQKLFESSQALEKLKKVSELPQMSPLAKKKSFLFHEEEFTQPQKVPEASELTDVASLKKSEINEVILTDSANLKTEEVLISSLDSEDVEANVNKCTLPKKRKKRKSSSYGDHSQKKERRTSIETLETSDGQQDKDCCNASNKSTVFQQHEKQVLDAAAAIISIPSTPIDKPSNEMVEEGDFKLSIQTNLATSTAEEPSAIATTTLSEITSEAVVESSARVSSSENEQTVLTSMNEETAEPSKEETVVSLDPVMPEGSEVSSESQFVPISLNPTVMSEKDLADAQVEITTDKIISEKKPTSLGMFSMDFLESSHTKKKSIRIKKTELTVLKSGTTLGTEFTSKAMTKEFDNRSLMTQPKAYALKSELLDILEGNSNSSTNSSGSEQRFKTSFDNYDKQTVVQGMFDFEEAIPSQIVLSNKVDPETVLLDSPKLLEKLSMSSDAAKAKTQKVVIQSDIKVSEGVPKGTITMAKPLGTPKPGQKILIKTTRAQAVSMSRAVGSKPIILSEQIIRPANVLKATKPTIIQPQGIKRQYEDIEDVETAFIISKIAKKSVEEETVSVTPEKPPRARSGKGSGKAKILQQTIITPRGEIVQSQAPTAAKTTSAQLQTVQAQPDDMVFDINSMPIVLSDDILTPESIQNMPVVLSEDVIAHSKPATVKAEEKVMPMLAKKTIAHVSKQQIVFKTTTSLNTTPLPAKQSPKPRILSSTSTNKVPKPCTTALLATGTSADGKPTKYVLVPSTVTPAITQAKSVKPPVLKKPPPPPVQSKLTSIQTTEPQSPIMGNKIMIVTNQHGQQTRVVLTPQQQKAFMQAQPGSKTKAIIKGAIPKALLESAAAGPSGVLQKVTLPSVPQGVTTTVSSQPGLLMTVGKGVKAPVIPKKSTSPKAPSKPQKTILIKNQMGQTVRKIQGTDDADLDRQVAEQLEAIKASARLQQANKMPEIINYTNRNIASSTTSSKAVVRRPHMKKIDTVKVKPTVSTVHVQSQKGSDILIPALAPISPQPIPQVPSQPTSPVNKVVDVTSQPQAVVPAKPESKATAAAPVAAENKPTDRPLTQLVIQDGLGNQTTITEGQILAIPSETVDGQPQSYMLVTLDEMGNITPLNNEALMSLDPSLGLGGDINNMVLQVDQGQGTVAALKPAEPVPEQNKMAERLHPEPPKMSQPAPEPKPAPVEQPKPQEVPMAVEQQIVIGEGILPGADAGGQQLIVTGDPIATQKFLESLSDGSTDLANILANAEGGSVLIQADGQQILIKTNTGGQPLLGISENTEGGGNPIFGTHKPNQDILAAALANTDVFQPSDQPSVHSSPVKGMQSQLSPGGGSGVLYPMHVSNVLETSLTLNSPIMTPLEVPSLPNKKISDDVDILSQVSKNVDLPITITDPNISQTVAQQQPIGLMELTLPISETTVTSDINSPSYSYSLPTLDEEVGHAQKPFNGSMPLLTEDVTEMESSSDSSQIGKIRVAKGLQSSESDFSSNYGSLPSLPETIESSREEEVKTSCFEEIGSLPMLTEDVIEDSGSSMGSSKQPRSSPKSLERDIVDEGLSTLGGEMCSSLSEPPPDMFDLESINPKEEEISSDMSSSIPEPESETLSLHSENSGEIPIQPPIVANLNDLKRPADEAHEHDEKRQKID